MPDGGGQGPQIGMRLTRIVESRRRWGRARRGLAPMASAVIAAGGLMPVLACAGGCADEPVGHSKTVEKRTVETPTEKTTTTETHEKDTTYTPR